MKLIRMSMENFMPYKGSTQIAFPLEDQRNVMIIFGENMRGKTSFLNALRWGFYGKAVGRQLREIPLHELHNKQAALEGDWTMEVRIEFEADNHVYNLLRRATKRSIVAKPSRAEDYVVEVLLQKDSIAVSGLNVESEINRFVPEQVSRFFLFDGELLQEYEELLIEGSEQGKGIKAAIEQVLGVPTLINGRSDVGTVLRSAQRQQAKDIAHISGLEGQAQKQSDLQTRRDAHESDLDKLRKDLSSKKAERASLDLELDKVESVHRAKLRLDFVRERQKLILEQQQDLKASKLSLMKEAWRDLLQPKLSLKRERLIARRSEISRALADRSRLEAQISGLTQLLETKKCPTCNQTLDSSNTDKHGAELGRIEAEIRSNMVSAGDLAHVNGEISFIENLLGQGVAVRVEEMRNATRKLDVELTKLDNERDGLEDEIRGFDTAEISRKRSLRDGLMREEGGLASKIEAVQKDIESISTNLAMIARALQNMPKARAIKSTSLVDIASAVEKIFSESVEILREKLRGHVQEKASEAFSKLTTQKSYSGLEINSNFGLRILDERGSHVAVRSAGAEQIVALSLIDGLARTGRAAGPVVMDTPFGRLDLSHRDNILKYLPTTTSQLVLLVHGGEIRRPDDLAPIASRIGAAYEIEEVNSRHSKLVRANV